MIFLTGFPSSGKTSLGKKVAKKLTYPFFDLDVFIEKIVKCSCREYFLRNGEDAFRKLEREALKTLSVPAKSIIALGGGALLHRENREFVKNKGLLIYLKVDKEILWGRLRSKKALPSYLNSSDTKQSFDNLYSKRQPIYEENADITVSLSCMSEKAIVEKIIENILGPICNSL